VGQKREKGEKGENVFFGSFSRFFGQNMPRGGLFCNYSPICEKVKTFLL